MEYKEALRRAAALCSRQEQASGHIWEKLNGWNVSEEDALRIMGLLKEEKYLDDNRFATFYVRDKFRFNGWGKVKLSAMLRQKGITQELIEGALDQIDESALVYFSARAALAAWLGSDTFFTVQRFRQNSGDRRFTNAACAGEQVGMVQPSGIESVDQRL